jgi:hypothetical protein
MTARYAIPPRLWTARVFRCTVGLVACTVGLIACPWNARVRCLKAMTALHDEKLSSAVPLDSSPIASRGLGNAIDHPRTRSTSRATRVPA